MIQQKKYRTISLIVWSTLYVVLCVIFLGLIDPDFDFKHRVFANLYGLSGLLSIPLWFVLIVGFSKFNGSSEKWWSKLLCELFPYPDRKPHGSLFRDIIFPTIIWSCFFLTIGPIYSFFAILFIGLVGYILLYNPMHFICQKSLLGFIALVTLLVIALILTIIHKRELNRSHIRYNSLAVLRTLFCVDISIIGYFLLSIGIVEGYFEISSFITIFKVNDYDLKQLGIVLLKPFINLLPGGLVLYYCRRELNCFLYAEDSYYLYLRSFQFDKKADSLLKTLPSDGKQIMKIGNPSSRLFPNLRSNSTIYHDVMFLPSSNWKKHLDYYIYKAFSVISVVDDTQGVVWEMFHHSEYYHKIVFYVDSSEKLCNLERMIAESEEFKSSPLLFYCISHLNKLELRAPFVFWIKGKRCYYDNANMVTSLLSTKLDCESKYYFNIDVILGNTTVLKEIDEFDKYKGWDNTSSILSLIRKVFSFINTKPFWLFPFMIVACSCLLFLLFFVASLCVGVESIIQGDILKGILVIVFDLVLSFFIVYGWYKQLAS